MRPFWTLVLTIVFFAALGGCSLIVKGAEGNGGDADTDTDTDTDADCDPDAYSQCGEDGHVHSFDSCDQDEGVSVECGENAQCVDTSDESAECQCVGNWDGPPECLDCAPGWTGDTCSGIKIHVDQSSSAGSPTGLDWASAFQSIVDGVAEACSLLESFPDASGAEVWVADGDYHVYTSSQTDTVEMCPGLSIYGGFEGTEFDLADRDPVHHRATLFGSNAAETSNVYHVVTGANGCLLDGLAISGGAATGTGSDNSGGGLTLTSGEMSVNQCVFWGNTADWGGAVYANSSSVNITGSTFYANEADQGGAVFADMTGALADIRGSVFSGNNASMDGGAVYVYEATAYVEASLFAGNSTGGVGGAIGFTNSDASIETSILIGNSANAVGGAVGMETGSDIDLVNDTVWRNTSGSAGAGVYSSSSTLLVANSLAWDNQAGSPSTVDDVAAPTGSVNVTYSGLSSGTWSAGNGNITPSIDGSFAPRFVKDSVNLGTVQSHSYSADTGLTEVVMEDALPMPPGQFQGSLFDADPWDTSMAIFVIASNAGNTLHLLGNATAHIENGDFAGLFDPSISPLSPAIDQGSDSLATTAVDFKGQTRADNVGRGDPGTITDMGAIETLECVRVVSGMGPSTHNGLTWNSGYETIKNGVDGAFTALQDPAAPDRCEIWVISGDHFVYSTSSADTLTMRQGVDLYGGFNWGSYSRDQADPMFNPSIVWGSDTISPTTNNVLHVITADTVTDAVLDGFVVTEGNCMGASSLDFGGGLQLNDSSMTIRNCHFTNNRCDGAGGVFANGSDLIIEGSRFSQNVADPNYGGAVYANATSTAVVSNSIFQGNSAVNVGGGISIDNGVDLSSSVFVGNHADLGNGGIDFYGGDSVAINNAVVGNTSVGSGAGAGITTSGTTQIVNSTFYYNTVSGSDLGGAIYNGSNGTVATNCIMWDDTPDEIYDYNSYTSTVSYSDVELQSSVLNHVISQNPGFVLAYESFDFGGGIVSFWYSNWTFTSSIQAPSGTSWDDGEMTGKYAVVDSASGPLWFYVVSNWSDTLTVLGDAEIAGIADDDDFEIWSLRPDDAGDSPVVDTGDDSVAPEFDIEGVPRADITGAGDVGTATDMGAYEFFL